MAIKSFLTKRQVMVLRLRQAGMTQEEIARRIKTTRANVSLIEKRARENIDRSRETLKEWESIVSPVRVMIKKGTDVIKVPEVVFAEADRAGIHVKSNSLDLITRIKKEKGSIISNRTLTEDMEIDITDAGEVSIL
ncbi:DNA-binding protein, Tfx family [Methanocella conradii HZ254]|uniref:DNA-binding protein, Tfx family n=1 Tax=Methanocella conradii (strain DSM 24694 / JCM 17849 / CGMCC 1.5162 / HZ254) TaxID=1041930 RepID=H8I940_METCZ|nr:Tfx family DNA-binding protein [Methanocella conradii]AFC99043.1 DNA-binding protein, Tfx family [Methanocella conradii HZ254]